MSGHRAYSAKQVAVSNSAGLNLFSDHPFPSTRDRILGQIGQVPPTEGLTVSLVSRLGSISHRSDSEFDSTRKRRKPIYLHRQRIQPPFGEIETWRSKGTSDIKHH
jgi:hypothetical protein